MQNDITTSGKRATRKLTIRGIRGRAHPNLLNGLRLSSRNVEGKLQFSLRCTPHRWFRGPRKHPAFEGSRALPSSIGTDGEQPSLCQSRTLCHWSSLFVELPQCGSRRPDQPPERWEECHTSTPGAPAES